MRKRCITISSILLSTILAIPFFMNVYADSLEMGQPVDTSYKISLFIAGVIIGIVFGTLVHLIFRRIGNKKKNVRI